MSKMGKNVLKLPGAVAAGSEEDEHAHAEHAEVDKVEVSSIFHVVWFHTFENPTSY